VATRRTLTPEAARAELDEINAELSVMLAEEPTVWYCEDLGRRVQGLLDAAQDAAQRGYARRLANRIAQAEDIQRRYATANGPLGETEPSDRPLADADGARPSDAYPPGEDDRFDGVGRLTRVLPPKLGAPRYALVDEQGRVRSYVSPAPGVNVRYYLGHRVGINGVQGRIGEQNAPHLTAKHITALDTRLR
jgi:hypothetical protein